MRMKEQNDWKFKYSEMLHCVIVVVVPSYSPWRHMQYEPLKQARTSQWHSITSQKT